MSLQTVTKYRRFTGIGHQDRHIVSTCKEGLVGEAVSVDTDSRGILRLLMVNASYDDGVAAGSNAKATIKFISYLEPGYDAVIFELPFIANNRTNSWVPPSPVIVGDGDYINVTLSAVNGRAPYVTIHYLLL